MDNDFKRKILRSLNAQHFTTDDKMSATAYRQEFRQALHKA
jgi:hypothetical protein